MSKYNIVVCILGKRRAKNIFFQPIKTPITMVRNDFYRCGKTAIELKFAQFLGILAKKYAIISLAAFYASGI